LERENMIPTPEKEDEWSLPFPFKRSILK